jgi:VWFA-related protein
MSYRTLLGAAFLALLVSSANAQVMSIPSSGFGMIDNATAMSGSSVMPGLTSIEQMTNNLWAITGAGHNRSPLENPSGSLSRLDLKAPGKARKEYNKGYQLLMQKDYAGAIEHLTEAISNYPEFVAAQNALGSAYLDLGQNDEARNHFAQAVSLDDHLPNSYLNLGCAQLALKDYSSAEESVKKASSIAPVDLQLATALTYTQFMNHDYKALLRTAHDVHSRPHEGAAMVHYFAAAAWDSLNNPQQTERELETLLKEDPKSPAAIEAKQILAGIKANQLKKQTQPVPALQPVASTTEAKTSGPSAEQLQAQQQWAAQEQAEQKQIAEAIAAEPTCATCRSNGAATKPGFSHNAPPTDSDRFTLRHAVDEVAVFFAATDHGKSVTDLTLADVGIHDDQKSPSAITGFRNEAQLPLRLGIVIDTSDSTKRRFSFEQHAAVDFLHKVLLQKEDLAFVVGVANSVLLVQDFTGDQQRISSAVDQLVPAGGTALWDAVNFAAGKLAHHPETQAVARMLIVISDGNDNSSNTTLKQAIETAERGGVFVYTVSTRESFYVRDSTMTDSIHVGDQALKILADETGGTSFTPGSVTWLNRSLNQLQEVIRSRYLVSYKPALFQRDGQYREIDITAQKDGHKLRVYARRGYYANASSGGQQSD